MIDPLRARHGAKALPVVIALMGACFNVVNGCLQGAWLFWIGPERAGDWLVSPAFLAGTGLFLAGVVINRSADAALRALRPAGETGYSIPRGGLYERVSCPNYLGEIVQWLGWALATWSLPGLAFAALDDREPAAACSRAPPLVSGALRRLPRGATRAHSVAAVSAGDRAAAADRVGRGRRTRARPAAP